MHSDVSGDNCQRDLAWKLQRLREILTSAGSAILLLPSDERGAFLGRAAAALLPLRCLSVNWDSAGSGVDQQQLSRLRLLADAEGYGAIFDAATAGETIGGEQRAAATRWGIASPLCEAMLSRADIALCRAGQGGCEAESIAGEHVLQALGLQWVRVRRYADIARLEVRPEDMLRVVELGREIALALRILGYAHVCLDLEGDAGGIPEFMRGLPV